MSTKLKEVKIPAKKWVQIGGDVNYEDYGLILGYYDPDMKEITVIKIDPPTEDLKTFSGEEETYEIEDLQEHTLEEFGLDPKGYEKHGLELIAEEMMTTWGGNPIDCGAGGFLQDLHDEFPNFDTALACAIGTEKSFTDRNEEEVKADKKKIKKPLPYLYKPFFPPSKR